MHGRKQSIHFDRCLALFVSQGSNIFEELLQIDVIFFIMLLKNVHGVIDSNNLSLKFQKLLREGISGAYEIVKGIYSWFNVSIHFVETFLHFCVHLLKN